MVKNRILGFFGTASLLVSGTAANALPVNGDFEIGNLTGWMSLGNTSVVDGTYGTGPIGGTYNALLETGFEKVGGGSSTGVTDADIESFFGLAAGTFDPLTPGGVTEGSAIKTSFLGTAGEKVSFDFKVLADDCDVSCPGGVEDFAFVSISVGGVAQVLTSTFGTVAGGSPSPYFAESGVFSFNHTLAIGGLVELGIAMLDGGDTIVPSALMVDNVLVDAVVPEPNTILGLLTARYSRLRFEAHAAK